MNSQLVSGALFADMVRGGAARLRANAAQINDMNVFPIPDGDTGDNMSMTLEAGVHALSDRPSERLDEVSERLAGGMLLGARGNSGVILSQLFAGMAEGLSGLETADVRQLSAAFDRGVEKAYRAVMTPTEGTILTVAREAAAYAASHLTDESTVEDFFADYHRELRASLTRTPDLLPVLKEAGVLDSGGVGYDYVLDGMERVLHGETVRDDFVPAPAAAAVDLDKFGPDTEMLFGYCTEVLLRLRSDKGDPERFDTEALTDFLSGVGDSIVAFRTGTVVKIHVHTRTPGRVLDYCQRFGEFLTVKIENMMLQHSESVFARPSGDQQPKPAAPPKQIGIVAVASGAGVCETFRQLGADEIVEGGQTNNPSSDDFLHAFARVNAEVLIVLPNNGNVILAAEQAARLWEGAEVLVLPSRTLGDGYAALSMFDPEAGSVDVVFAQMRDAMQGVETVSLCPAVRESHLSGVSVRAGDVIAVCEKQILCAAPDALGCAERMLGQLDLTGKSVCILLCGAEATEAGSSAMTETVRRVCPALELYTIDGGQDVYPFIFIFQ
ncbi:MAG: DAK2 domain-containing protein [Clostridia bacterium]|nr:DAK2 domain-containing protein [Clostridia bacterium]